LNRLILRAAVLAGSRRRVHERQTRLPLAETYVFSTVYS
jgi:hypothetical protein